jgi:hypothetical protein
VLVLLVDALEHRQEVMAKDLVALFDAVRLHETCPFLVSSKPLTPVYVV